MKKEPRELYFELDATPAQQRARRIARVVINKHGRLALELTRDVNVVYIPMAQAGETFDLADLPPKIFDAEYTKAEGYGVDYAARLFLGFALDRGATPEVLDALATLVPLSAQEKEIAMTKKKAAVAAAEKKVVADEKKASAANKKAAGAKKKAGAAAAPEAAAHAASPTAAAQVKPAKPTKERKRTAAAAFRELILKGGQTDDEIFKAVQKEFALNDGQRSYVVWYRNDLRKRGEKVPDPVKPKEPAKA